MLQVLIVDLSRRWGGASVRVCQLATGLGQDARVTVAVLDGSETQERLEASGVQTWPVRLKRKDPRLISALMTAIRTLKPAVVDAHNSQSILWGLTAARLARVPTRIATIHSAYEVSEKRVFGGPLFLGLYQLMNRTATDVIAISDVVTEHLLTRGVPASRIHTIRNGMPVTPCNGPRSLDAGPLRVVTVGRLVTVKAQANLIEAIANLAGDGVDVSCRIVGDGPERSALETRSRALGVEDRVAFLGFRNDVADILAESDIFCLPSLTEGLPFAALEAAAQALPIVASRVGGLARHFTDRATAMLVPAGDVDALTHALRFCAENRTAAAAMGWRAWQLIAREFGVEQMLANTRGIYRSGMREAAGHEKVDCGPPVS